MSNIITPVFGWLPPEERTTEQKQIHEQLVLAMPAFKLIGNGYWKANERSPSWDCIKKIRGKHLPTWYQNVGSCVGQGKGRCEWNLMHIEKILAGDREIPIMPYEPYGYAQSRVCAGILGGGDGSTGSGAAEAAKKYGVLNSTLPGLPAWKESEDEINWPGSVDRSWGSRGAPAEWVEKGKKHLVRTTSLLKNTDEAVAALHNGYPLTLASNWGGMMNPPVKGDKFPVRLNKRATTWNHQMSCDMCWDHPELGLIFWIQNSWGPNAHGNGPDDCPKGGFWIPQREFQSIIDQRETFAYSQFDGFPETGLDKALFKLI